MEQYKGPPIGMVRNSGLQALEKSMCWVYQALFLLMGGKRLEKSLPSKGWAPELKVEKSDKAQTKGREDSGKWKSA